MVRRIDDCDRFGRWLTPYLDNELDAVHTIEVEEHLDLCEQCRERVALGGAMRASLRRVAPMRAPMALRERMLATLQAERADSDADLGGEISASESVAERAPLAPSPEQLPVPILAAAAVAQAEPMDQQQALLALATQAAQQQAGLFSPSTRAQRPEARSPSTASLRRPELVKGRYVWPLAAAAAFVLVLGGIWNRANTTIASPIARSTAAQTGGAWPIEAKGGQASNRAGAHGTVFPGLGTSEDQQWGFGPTDGASIASLGPLDGLLEDLVTHHVEQLPPETTDPRSLEKYDRFVGVRVSQPRFDRLGARYVGARVRPVMEGHRAAVLQYIVGTNHRLTVYVFNAEGLPMRGRLLQQRDVGKRQVFVGRLRGYSVAAGESGGVGYALASDLDDEKSTELMLAAGK